MFRFNDFFHLPQLDPLFNQIVAEGSGLTIVAGIEAHATESHPAVVENLELDPSSSSNRRSEPLLPSGLSTLFDILITAMLSSDPLSQAIIVARGKSLARVPRQFKRRIKLYEVEGQLTYERQISYAIEAHPTLLVVDRLDEMSALAAFRAASRGLKVITSLDTIQHGIGVVRHVLALGVPPEQFATLRWVVTMQRLPTLCEKCRQPFALRPVHLETLANRYPHLDDIVREYGKLVESSSEGERTKQEIRFYVPGTCGQCHQTGRLGDVAVFDVLHASGSNGSSVPFDIERILVGSSQLSLEEYVLHLAARGMVCLDDLLWFDVDRLHRTYTLLTTSEKALTEANSTLSRKLFELEANNRVLLQRTEVLISLEDLGQALIASVSLAELANRVSRRAGELCGADRVILYLLRTTQEKGDWVEILAVRGWEGANIRVVVDLLQAFGNPAEKRVMRYTQIPPGIEPRPEFMPDVGPNTPILSGLRVPLMAQDRQVGAMIVQSTQKGFFTPGETALLQTFANQAALAIQRAGLVDDLRGKISELEVAQAELVKKERMERELELARQVQQSLLPVLFPEMPGFKLAVRNEPARQVGGDFYDVIQLDEDHFGIVVADVSDKGMPAALYMALSRSLLLAEAHRQLSPLGVLQSVNRLLLELGDIDGFVSVFYGVVECSSQLMRYARAGHEKPFLMRSMQPLIHLKGEGVVLGILEEHEFRLTEEEVHLEAGDRLILYSDGMTDVVGEDGAFFGGEKLVKLFGTLAGVPIEEICNSVFKTLNQFRGNVEQFDDMTMLILEIAGP